VLLYTHRPIVHWPRNWSQGWRATEEPSVSNFRCKLNEKWQEQPMTEELSGQDEQQLDSLPVRINIVLGERELSFAELKALNTGSILELDHTPDQPVRLIANGRWVGDGELVRVEDRLGVRILNWRAV
jgi:type III secretion system YscQ/HrcQ family protein